MNTTTKRSRSGVAVVGLGVLLACGAQPRTPSSKESPSAQPTSSAPSATARPVVEAKLELGDASAPRLCLSAPEKWLPISAITARAGNAKKPLEDAVAAYQGHVAARREQSRANVGLAGNYYGRREDTERAARKQQETFARARSAIDRELGVASPPADRVALLLGLEFLRANAEDESGNRLAAVPNQTLCPPHDPYEYTRRDDPDCEAAFAARKGPDPLDDYLFACLAHRRVKASTVANDALFREAPATVQAALRGRRALAFIVNKQWDEAAKELRAALQAPESKHPARHELARLLFAVETKRSDDAALAAVADALPLPLASFVEPLVVDLWARKGILPSGSAEGVEAFRMYTARFEELRGRHRAAEELTRGISSDTWAGRILLASKGGTVASDPKERARQMLDGAEVSGLDTILKAHIGPGSAPERILRSIGRACSTRTGSGPLQRTYTETLDQDPMGACIRQAMQRTLPDVRYVLEVRGRVMPLLE
jgi:hypothetical protein